MAKKQRGKGKKSTVQFAVIGVAVTAVLVVAAFLLWPEPVADHLAFKKEGTLTFLNSSGDDLRTIDVEIADDSLSRKVGMMYRRDMAYSQGMLFVFEEVKLQSFWMHNTYLSLDLMYVDRDSAIVTIHTDAKPLSNAPLYSTKEAQFVVEVKAGFVERYGIKEGDRISVTRSP